MGHDVRARASHLNGREIPLGSPKHTELRTGLHTRCRMCPILCRTLCHNLFGHLWNLLSIRDTSGQFRSVQPAVASIKYDHSWTLLSLAVLFTFCVRNEEAGGSNPLSSTRF